VERAAVAHSGVPTGWADALPGFTAAVEAEAARTGVPLPAGFQTITGAAPTSGG
jgi:hypothetical protein